ncbi:MAG: hypothetical protein KDB07_09475, partial [Planctomycetes bacterium]|nr:hypothetical protein [Planctomycetota bacterium]
MSNPLNPERSFENLKDGVAQAIQEYFPGGEYKGKRQTLRLKGLKADDSLDYDDFVGQQEVKEKDGSWAVPLKADFELVDNATGKVVDQKTMTLAKIPKITPRFSYIVDGKERQVDHQSLLKRGIYTRISDSGKLETRFNTKTPEQYQTQFQVFFDPDSHTYSVKSGDTEVPLVPVLKAMGVSDKQMVDAWGRDIALRNTTDPDTEKKQLKRLYRKFYRKDSDDLDELIQGVRQKFGELSLDPEVTEMTVGEKFNQVNGKAFLAATRTLIDINRGDAKPTGYDDLRFKEIRHTEDFVPERIRDARRQILPKLSTNIDRVDSIDRIVSSQTFNKPVKSFFTNSQLSVLGDQTNPLGMLSGHTKHTILGEHGISSSHQLTQDAKIIHPSTYGFKDPVHTPECFTPDTEVFTESGWKKWPTVTEEDRLACRIDGRLEFHHPERLIRSLYAGPIYTVTSPRIEYAVTPNHRLYVRPLYGTQWRIMSAEEAHGSKLRYTSTHEPLLGEEGLFELPAPSVVNNKTLLAPSIPMDDWCAFLGWFLSEGSNIYDPHNSQYHTRVHQIKPEHLQEIRDLLDRLPFTWFENADGSFGISTRQLAEYLSQFGKAQDKFIPPYVFTAPVAARTAILESLLKGDGRLTSNRATGVTYNQKVYTTTSPELAADVERLAIGLGYAVTVAVYPDLREERYLDIYEVRLLRHREWQVDPERERSRAKYEIHDFIGEVFCATVPGGLLLVRKGDRRKVAHWSGNSDRTGISLQIPLGTWKEGNELVTTAINAKTGKVEKVTAKQLAGSNLAFPDQYRILRDKPPQARVPRVTVADKEGNTVEVKPNEVDYVIPNHSNLFSATTNLVPFLQNNNGNRVGYGTQQAHQALALVNREEPLVQSATGAPSSITGEDTFEGLMGQIMGHRSKASGVVTAVSDKTVTVKKKDGSTVEHPLYNNFPLNNKKGVLNSTSLVKVGDEVKTGQPLADHSFTKNGKLALGSNLTVGYIPADGYNFEDGIVVSESAAQKMTSEHMYKKELDVGSDGIHVGLRKFQATDQVRYTKDQLQHIDADGVVAVGAKVKPGDPLVLAVKKNAVKSEAEGLARVSKGMVQDWKADPIEWEGDGEGIVTKVIR